jgi:hypothetical protein
LSIFLSRLKSSADQIVMQTMTSTAGGLPPGVFPSYRSHSGAQDLDTQLYKREL